MTDLVSVSNAVATTAVSSAVGWEQALEVFLGSLNSPGTQRTYALAVREAFLWLGAHSPADVTPAQLLGYRAHLVEMATQRTRAPGTVATKLAALRSFWRFCRMTGLSDMSQETVRFALAAYNARVDKPYEVLSSDEQERLVSTLRTLRCQQRERDLALVALMLATGLRAGEVARLMVGDLMRDGDGDCLVYVRQGKGRRDRVVPLSGGVFKLLQQWLRFTGRTLSCAEDRDTYVFYGGHGLRWPLTTRRIQQIVEFAVQQAGIDKQISPHSLRHTAAMAWLRDGASLPVVQRLLGHSSVATTQRYVDHLEEKELKRWARDVA